MNTNKSFYFGAIDLGGTFIKCGILDEYGNIIIKNQIPTKKDRPHPEIIKDMAENIKNIAIESNINFNDIKAIGIGAPGTVNSKTGLIYYSNNIAWKNVPLGEELSIITKTPVFVTNDANAAALGECFKGAGSKFSDMVMITLGTGVGGGIVIDGKLFEGNKSAGAEIGHMVLKTNGAKCTCGRRGCFEAYASATALIRETEKEMKKHPESLLYKFAPNGVPDGKTPFDALDAGDKVAKKVINKYITYLAEGIANIINLFRPQAIVVGGGVCAQGESLLKPLRRKVNKLIYGGNKYAPVKIISATLGNDAGLIGAGRFAQQNI